jgi:two-component system, OmpR family, sensor histidine kinase KdpD
MGRAALRVYLGAAPGVGKTYRMLEEGHRRKDRGTDVVVGFVEPHGRPHTEALVAGLEVVPRRDVTYRGATFEEMDVDAILARRPDVALVDELAHTNVPGSRNAKRWQDIENLVEAGITVITSVNVQHLESINDVVQQITGVPQRETVPDAVVRRAEQVELVDMAPEAIRRRMAHGNIYRPEKVDAALGNYFRVGNLTALRELALLWLADKVDEQLDRYRAEHRIAATWEARERVVVALTGGPEGDTLIRRAARIAARTKGADVLAVHVSRNDGLAESNPAFLARQRSLVESIGGTYHQVVGSDIATALLDFARGVNASQLVLGASRRGRLAHILSPGVGLTTAARSGPIDVHLVTHEEVGRGRRLGSSRSALTIRRRIAGFVVSLVGLPLLTIVLAALRSELTLPSDMLAYVAWVVVAALVGGLWSALIAVALGTALLNYYFTEPIHTFNIAERENLLALIVFLAVAVAVSITVDRAARRTREAASARAEAETLSTLAGSVVRGSRVLPALLDQLRETYGFSGVTLLERRDDEPGGGPDVQRDPNAWRVAAAVGDQPSLYPAHGDASMNVDDKFALVLRGHPLAAADRRVVEAFAAQAAVALRSERLAEQAAELGSLSEVDKMRTALLAAVSHDLRTPLASARAAVDGLLSQDVAFSDEDRDELLATVGESLERLTRLVDNLLDMSRLQAGALGLYPQPMSMADAVAKALDDLGPAGLAVTLVVPDEPPEVNADPAMIERVLANLLANAQRYSPSDRPPMVSISEHAGYVETRVIDHGPGIPATAWDTVFLPFQRLGDRDNDTGVGLGLALSRGLVEAMGGTLTPETTPGGGLTMTVRLPTAESPDSVPASPALLDRIDHWREEEPHTHATDAMGLAADRESGGDGGDRAAEGEGDRYGLGTARREDASGRERG